MINYILLFYIAFVLIGSIHICCQTVFLSKSISVYLNGSSFNEGNTNREISYKRILKAINLFLFVCPFIVFNWVIDTNFENTYINSLLLITTLGIAVFSFYFNFKHIWPKAFNQLSQLYNKIGALEKDEEVLLDLSTNNLLDLEPIDKSDLIQCKEADKLPEIEESFNGLVKELIESEIIYSSVKKAIKIHDFSINEKQISEKEAWLILIVFWFEEYANSYKYLTRLDSKYYKHINHYYIDKKENKIDRRDWNNLKKKIQKSENTFTDNEFYNELKIFKKKNSYMSHKSPLSE